MKIVFWFWLSHLLWAIILSFLLFSSLGSMAAKAETQTPYNQKNYIIPDTPQQIGEREAAERSAKQDAERTETEQQYEDRIAAELAKTQVARDEKVSHYTAEDWTTPPEVKGVANSMLLTFIVWGLVMAITYILIYFVIFGIPLLLIYFLIIKPMFKKFVRYTGAQWRGES